MSVVKFVGIDDWNRPVFKAKGKKAYYVSLDILFPYGESKESVLSKVKNTDLTYYGPSLNCEPYGDSCNVTIDRS